MSDNETADRGAHRPVLLPEAVAALRVQAGGIYLDATFGRGGHSRVILSKLGEAGRLLVIDKDPRAIEVARDLAREDRRVVVHWGSFTELGAFCQDQGVAGRVSGVLMDLGVSSPQLDDPARGFSFRFDGPLDMRMDPEHGDSVATWLARAPEAEIAQVLKVFGEERFSRRVARALVAARKREAITTTGRLAELVAEAVPTREPGQHPATRSFMAFRIRINRELEDLPTALEQALGVLAPGGRLVAISFHSLEDRIVKRFFRDQSHGTPVPRGMPLPESLRKRRAKTVGKLQRPGDRECAQNPRARSALLRVLERQ